MKYYRRNLRKDWHLSHAIDHLKNKENKCLYELNISVKQVFHTDRLLITILLLFCIFVPAACK